jgi:hypothetical protein
VRLRKLRTAIDLEPQVRKLRTQQGRHEQASRENRDSVAYDVTYVTIQHRSKPPPITRDRSVRHSASASASCEADLWP